MPQDEPSEGGSGYAGSGLGAVDDGEAASAEVLACFGLGVEKFGEFQPAAARTSEGVDIVDPLADFTAS